MKLETAAQADLCRRIPAMSGDLTGCTARRGAAGILGRIVSVVFALITLSSCGSGQPGAGTAAATAQPSAAVTPSATSTPRLIYQADWSHGLAGWIATPGWTVSNGALESDTGDNREATSPFQPATPDYAIEFRLRIMSIPQAGGQYQLSADSAAGSDGYDALVDHLLVPGTHEFADHPNEQITINPYDSQDPNTLQVHDFEPGTDWRTYRVEVRGPEATLLVDGRVLSWARSTKTPHLSAGPLRFSCSGVGLLLTGFTVYSL